MSVYLVTGGVRSGKSRFAESLTLSLGERILVVVTGTPGDEEMERRIAVHRARRPPEWEVLEEPVHVAERLKALPSYDVVLVDCLSTWVANRLLSAEERAIENPAGFEAEMVEEVRVLLTQLSRHTHGILVTSEVGLGGVALSPIGRRFQDILGLVNQAVAQEADEVWFVASGVPWRLKG
jgi:adenosylcobinamide kinase/adenosylcobinamide-phosphate guanylyltransferase